MIVVIRIAGQVNIPSDVDETLYRMRLRRKYTAVLLENNSNNQKLLNKIRNFVSFGVISESSLKRLNELRGGKTKEGKILFYRLHPPRGGIESKKHFGVGKGVLGDHKDKINELLMRML